MTFNELNDHFGLPGVLAFDLHHGLTRALVTLPTCTAAVYLHGAHLASWQPAGQAEVLFLSERSVFAPGEPIRGGIPICFPWFGNGPAGDRKPSHGFARLQEWTPAFAALLPGTAGGADTLRLTLTLGPSGQSSELGFPDFRAAYELIFGAPGGLTLKLTVANPGVQPFSFEEALHTYFAITDVRQTTLSGVESATFVDKTDGFKQKSAPAGPLSFTAQTDSVFPGNTDTVTIHAPGRTIEVAKIDSSTTVVWNPWAEASARIPDLAPDAWPHFVCVETANAGVNALTLQPGQTHTMEAHIRVLSH